MSTYTTERKNTYFRIAVSGTHGVGKTTLIQKVVKKLKKVYRPERIIVENEYIRDNIREDIGENQTEEATIYYLHKAFALLAKAHECREGYEWNSEPKIVIYDRAWFDTVIYYVASVAYAKDKFKTLVNKKNEFYKLHAFVYDFAYKNLRHLSNDNVGFGTNYDMIVFNQLPNRQYKMSVPNDGVRPQSIGFRNIVNDFFTLFYQKGRFYNHRTRFLHNTKVVTNTTPLGSPVPVNRFINTLVNNEIMPSFYLKKQMYYDHE